MGGLEGRITLRQRIWKQVWIHPVIRICVHGNANNWDPDSLYTRHRRYFTGYGNYWRYQCATCVFFSKVALLNNCLNESKLTIKDSS